MPLLVREHPKASSWRPVGTGNDEHVEPTIEALEGGAHVFVEKPMAFRVDQARARVESAERHGVRLGVDYNHRFSEPYRRALVFRDEGALGEIAYIDMKFAGDLYKDLNDPHCMLVETQGHAFDLMRLFGGEIAEVSAFLSDPRRIGVYTSTRARVRSGYVAARSEQARPPCLHIRTTRPFRTRRHRFLPRKSISTRLSTSTWRDVVEASKAVRRKRQEEAVHRPRLILAPTEDHLKAPIRKGDLTVRCGRELARQFATLGWFPPPVMKRKPRADRLLRSPSALDVGQTLSLEWLPASLRVDRFRHSNQHES